MAEKKEVEDFDEFEFDNLTCWYNKSDDHMVCSLAKESIVPEGGHKRESEVVEDIKKLRINCEDRCRLGIDFTDLLNKESEPRTVDIDFKEDVQARKYDDTLETAQVFAELKSGDVISLPKKSWNL